MVLSGLRFGPRSVLICAVLIHAVLQMKVEARGILGVLGALGCTSGQQVRRQGTAQ